MGGGLGVGEVCGAVSGGVMAIGLTYEQREIVGPKTKEFVRCCAERYGALRCIDLLGLDVSTEEGVYEYKARNLKEKTCIGLVSSAVQMLLDLMREWDE